LGAIEHELGAMLDGPFDDFAWSEVHGLGERGGEVNVPLPGGFAFDELAAEDDALIDQEGVSLLVDAMSYPYLIGAKVDYREDLQGAKFVVENPNAASTCGCGASFSI